jgi:hypothetical protein
MNADVESVRKPVRLICIFLGSGVCVVDINTGVREKCRGKWIHRLRFILKESHGVLDEDLVLETDELHDLFSNPRSNDLQVDLTHIYLDEMSECVGDERKGSE